jgi:hypothetical protein
MGVWQGVAMDSLKFQPGLPCPTLLCSAGGPPLKQTYGSFRDVVGLQLYFTLLDTPRRTLMVFFSDATISWLSCNILPKKEDATGCFSPADATSLMNGTKPEAPRKGKRLDLFASSSIIIYIIDLWGSTPCRAAIGGVGGMEGPDRKLPRQKANKTNNTTPK